MFRSLFCSLFVVLMSANAHAGPIVQWRVEDGGNGHYYQFVEDHVIWPTANTAASAMSHLGLQGHLATIASAAENDFIFANILEPSAYEHGAWIGLTDNEAFGGFESFGQPNPMADGWVWVTGEPVDYTAWNPFSGEPNNFDGDEDFAVIHVFQGNLWNDRELGREVAYIVEFEATTVPEPASMLIWGTLATIAASTRGPSFRRRRQDPCDSVSEAKDV